MIVDNLRTLPRDVKYMWRVIKSLHLANSAGKNNRSIGKLFDSYAKQHPEKVCFYFQDEKWTYKRVLERSNRVGNYFEGEGFRKNDVISMYMDSRPEYVCTWLGLCKIGVVPALINFNLNSTPLQHSIDLAKSKAIICSYELAPAINELYPKGSSEMAMYGTGEGNKSVLTSSKDVDSSLDKVSKEIPKSGDDITMNDNLFYIYTSGTTGFPKAAIIKHARYMAMASVCHVMADLRPDDIFYTTLPLYHTAGGIVGIGQALIFGSSVVIRNKFSAKNFWTDCIKYNVTAAQYMGETCRYLLRQPPSPEEKQHKTRVMLGNGLRSEIWTEFVTRFNISNITEVYGSTEGNASLACYTNQVGATGIVPEFLQKAIPVNIIKLDDNEEPVRDPKTGLVIRCKPGECGELVGKIVRDHPFRDFKGYAGDKKANQKKTVDDVLKKGDSFFRTGDLFIRDKTGYYYFKDRIGDSFRWKGENVSSAQVEYVISNLADLRDTVVYGVKIPGSDGQAGMGTIADPAGSLDVNSIVDGMKKSLPPYAVPKFLRVVQEIEMTGTHKMKKKDLQSVGFDITKASNDKIYFLSDGKYITLDENLYNSIISGSLQL